MTEWKLTFFNKKEMTLYGSLFTVLEYVLSNTPYTSDDILKIEYIGQAEAVK